MVDDCGSSATAASGSVRSRESRCSRVPPISPWDSGQTVMEWSRPVSACAERGSASCLGRPGEHGRSHGRSVRVQPGLEGIQHSGMC